MAKKIDYGRLFTLRSDGRYQGSYKDESGKQRFVCDKDPEKLYYKLEELQKPKVPIFKDIAEAWHDKYWESYKSGTKACYKSMYDRAVAEQGEKDAALVSSADISKQLQKLAAKQMSTKSLKTLRTIYKLIYQNAITDDYYSKYITNNPALNVPIPSQAKPAKKREAPEDEVVEKIRANATTAYFGLFAMLLISTGFRRGEALALTWGDIDFKAETISCNKSLSYRGKAEIGETKTSSGVRVVPLLADLRKVLKKPKGAKSTDYVFQSESGGYLPQSTYTRHWMHYCKDMGFVSVKTEERKSKQGKQYLHHEYKVTLTPHVLRHGYATMLYDAGVDVYTAQKLLGHANVETTIAIYTHLSKKKQQQSLDMLNEYITNGYTPSMANSMAKSSSPLDNA